MTTAGSEFGGIHATQSAHVASSVIFGSMSRKRCWGAVNSNRAAANLADKTITTTVTVAAVMARFLKYILPSGQIVC